MIHVGVALSCLCNVVIHWYLLRCFPAETKTYLHLVVYCWTWYSLLNLWQQAEDYQPTVNCFALQGLLHKLFQKSLRLLFWVSIDHPSHWWILGYILFTRMTSNALISNSPLTRNQETALYLRRGPGLTVFQFVNAGARPIESVLKATFHGPKGPKAKIDKFFSEGEARESVLDELYKADWVNPTKQHKKLLHNCRDLLTYANPQYVPNLRPFRDSYSCHQIAYSWYSARYLQDAYRSNH